MLFPVLRYHAINIQQLYVKYLLVPHIKLTYQRARLTFLVVMIKNVEFFLNEVQAIRKASNQLTIGSI